MPSTIPAAGTIPWRVRKGNLEVALVHRPRYDDWSWAKGKIDPGEAAHVAATRETIEETGLEVRLGLPLPMAEYPLLDSKGAPARKIVHYWAAEVTGGEGVLEHEIDEVAWLDVRTANDRLDYTRDREQLLAVVRAERAGRLQTWPLAIVRHARAVPRGSWKGSDPDRPLSEAGREQVVAITRTLAAYGITRVLTSTSARCVQTVEPYAAQRGLTLRTREQLSEEAFERDPERAARQLDKALERGEPVALCTHGPLIPALLERLADHAAPEEPDYAECEDDLDHLRRAQQARMIKGEVLVAHMVGRGHDAEIVAIERHFA